MRAHVGTDVGNIRLAPDDAVGSVDVDGWTELSNADELAPADVENDATDAFRDSDSFPEFRFAVLFVIYAYRSNEFSSPIQRFDGNVRNVIHTLIGRKKAPLECQIKIYNFVEY